MIPQEKDKENCRSCNRNLLDLVDIRSFMVETKFHPLLSKMFDGFSEEIPKTLLNVQQKSA